MARYDLESLLNDLKAVAVANLNAKLSAISSEKNDDIALLPVPNEAYFFQVLDKKKAGHFPAFIFYGASDPTVQAIGAGTAEDYEVFFIAVLRETAEGEAFSTRLLRYSRALKEIFETAFTQNKIRTRISVSSITPTNFAIQDQPGSFRGVGVKVRAVLA